MKLLGAILAGGQSRRFGSDKAVALLDGRPLIAHAAAALAPLVSQTIVCGRSASLCGLIAVADRPGPDLGPLGGLNAALHYAAVADFDAIVSVGCDTPLLPEDAMRKLIETPGAGYFRQSPIIGRWPVALAEILDRHLHDCDDRSIRRWADAIGAAAIDVGHDIPNLNSPQDLARTTLSIR